MNFNSFTFDAAKKNTKPQFKFNKTAETDFYRALKKVARASGNLIESHVHGTTLHHEDSLIKTLEEYSKTIEPWAIRQSQKMLESVNRKNKAAFATQSDLISKLLRQNLTNNSIDVLARGLMDDHVKLIKSLPLEAGKRAQRLAMEAIYEGSRAIPDQSAIEDIKKQLGVSTEVAESRAYTIARTETARANASITEVRAVSLGCRGYVWECSLDGAERHSHREMHGKYILYSKVPTLSDGTTGHAGTLINCRCWQRIIFGD